MGSIEPDALHRSTPRNNRVSRAYLERESCREKSATSRMSFREKGRERTRSVCSARIIESRLILAIGLRLFSRRCWRESNRQPERLRELPQGSCALWKRDRIAPRSASGPAMLRCFSPRCSRSPRFVAERPRFAQVKVAARSSALPERAERPRFQSTRQQRADAPDRSAFRQPATAEREPRAPTQRRDLRC